MLDAFYHLFRGWELEGILQFGILSYALYILCCKRRVWLKPWIYVTGCTFLFAVIQWVAKLMVPATYSTIIGTWALPYWFGFTSNIILAAFCAHILLNNSLVYKITYILFYIAFIMLYKIVCSPLYELESTMNVTLYQILDLLTLGVQLLLLILLTVLFRRYKLQTSIQLPSKGLLFTLYFPISILVCYTLSSNSRVLYHYSNPMIALIILPDLPMIYYILCMFIRSYEEQRRLDDALTQTQAQLSRYRFSIELQERLKKERHELKNNYFYIQTLLQEKKYDQLNDYMENVISEDTLCTILLNLLDNAIPRGETLQWNLPDYQRKRILHRNRDDSTPVIFYIVLNQLTLNS